ncbi:MAG TPA: hypothetical protein VNT30_24110 [Stellaceae bacterium]|nr:hypothetical protein [Stellaceae bacterium]
MNLYRCYLRKGVVYLPTTGRIWRSDIAFRIIEPVEVISVGDTAALKRGLVEMIIRGNQPLSLEESRDSTMLMPKYAGVKTQRSFERGTLTWSIKDRDGVLTIDPYRRHPQGGWEIDEKGIIALPPGTTTGQLCDRMVAILQAYAANPALAAAHEAPPVEPEPFGTVYDGYLMPPDNEERHESVEGLMATIVNLEPGDVPDVRANIKRVFYDVGDRQGGDAFTRALAEALEPGIDLDGRRRILQTYDPYTIGLPVDAVRYGRDPVTGAILGPKRPSNNPYDVVDPDDEA